MAAPPKCIMGETLSFGFYLTANESSELPQVLQSADEIRKYFLHEKSGLHKQSGSFAANCAIAEESYGAKHQASTVKEPSFKQAIFTVKEPSTKQAFEATRIWIVFTVKEPSTKQAIQRTVDKLLGLSLIHI